MSLHLHIDHVEPTGWMSPGFVSIRGWCLDERSAPCRDLSCRIGSGEFPVSREWRPDLARRFPGHPDSGWGGFLVRAELDPGFRRIRFFADGRLVWSRRLLSGGMVRSEEGRVWPISGNTPSCGAGRPLPAVDVIGVFYSKPPSAGQWFSSLAEEQREVPGLRVFVIEHGPEPVVPDLVAEWSRKLPVESRHYPSNPGFGAGCNAGARIGKAPFLFFLNPDAALVPGSLGKLLEMAVSASSGGFVGWEAAQMPWEHPKIYHPLTGETEWSSAACWLLSRQAFERVGGFDEKIFLYGEDVDLSWRLREDGGRLAYLPEARVVHESYRGDEVSTGKKRQIDEGARSDAYLREKYGRTRAGSARRPEGGTVCRFLSGGYEVERSGTGFVPLLEARGNPSVVLRVRKAEGGFDRTVWNSMIARMTGVRVRLVWMDAPSGTEEGEEWRFDAESNWMLFPDALAQMVASAERGGTMAVRGAGLGVLGEIREGAWSMNRFAMCLPPVDPGTGFRPGVLRRGEGAEAKPLPKAFWLENLNTSIRRQGG